MAGVALTYEHWLEMNDKERARVVASWNPYAGEGAEILTEAVERFKQRYGGRKGIKDIYSGLYHGGQYAIGVTLASTAQVRLPKRFSGFPVIKLFQRTAGRKKK